MEKYHPSKPFERYADDIVVHCKTEKQALYMLRIIQQRFSICKLQVHGQKTKIINLRVHAEKEYPKGFDFLGFTIRPNDFKGKTGVKAFPGIFVSKKSRKSITQKFKEVKIHKWRKPLQEIADKLNPVIRGIINYYHKFRKDALRKIWAQLNYRLLKWVKWEKGLYKYEAVRYLKLQYKKNPRLFEHWLLVRP